MILLTIMYIAVVAQTACIAAWLVSIILTEFCHCHTDQMIVKFLIVN